MMDAHPKQAVIDNASAKIAAVSRPVLRAAHDGAWDLQVPTQSVVDGLTARVQKAITDIKTALIEKIVAQELRLKASGEELADIAEKCGLPVREDEHKQKPSIRVSWSDLKQQFQDQEYE